MFKMSSDVDFIINVFEWYMALCKLQFNELLMTISIALGECRMEL